MSDLEKLSDDIKVKVNLLRGEPLTFPVNAPHDYITSITVECKDGMLMHLPFAIEELGGELFIKWSKETDSL